MIHRHWDAAMLFMFLLSAVMGIVICFLVRFLLVLLEEGMFLVSQLSVAEGWVPILGSGFLILLLWLTKEPRLNGVIDLHQYIHTGSRKDKCAPSIPMKTAIVSTLGHGLVLSFGSISGVLGPLVFASTNVAAFLYRFFYKICALPKNTEHHLMAAAGAATITAVFNAPFAGIFFGLEVVLRQPSLRRLMPVMIASISSAITQRLYFPDIHILSDLSFEIVQGWEYIIFCFMGLIIGFAALFFAYNIEFLRAVFSRLPEPLKRFTPLFGGGVVAILLLFWPDDSPRLISLMILPQLLGDQQQLEHLLILFPLFWIGVVCCVGSGNGLGLLGPSLVLGALIGAVFWSVIPEIIGGDGVISNLSVYALVGMAAMSAALLGAPIFAFIFAFEVSLSYSMTTAVMISSLLASQVMMSLGARSIFHYLRHDYRR